VAQRADAARAASEEAADGGDATRRRIHEKLLSRFAHGIVQPRDARAGLHAHAARLDRKHLVDLGHVENDAAFQRHALAVIAGAATANGDRDAQFRGRGRHSAHLILIGRDDDEVTHEMANIFAEDGAVPEIIARTQFNLLRIVVDTDAIDLAAKGGPVIGAHGLGRDVHAFLQSLFAASIGVPLR
jgi:hypothetical protein